MDPHHFDALTQRFSASRARTRRSVLAFATAISAAGGIWQGAGPPAVGAGRKSQRKKRRKRRCGAAAQARLCTSACGPQTLCGKIVACEPCCSSATECQTAGRGTLCCNGLCLNGNCCNSIACANPTPVCAGNTCTSCTGASQCPSGQDCLAATGDCCNPEGVPCTVATTMQCCSRVCDFSVGGGACASCRGRSCSATVPCCGGLSCINGSCDGCGARATSCTVSSQCCFSNCTNGACFSAIGGPCANDADCRTCYQNSNLCGGACVNSVCTR